MPTRPCRVEIDLSALAHNLRLLQRAAGDATLAAIVKGNAYGHSLELCAPAAVNAGAQWLAVTSTDEALSVVCACSLLQDQPRILVLSGPFPGDGEAVAKHGFTCSVWQRDQLEELARGALAAGSTSVPVHLEIDTGMSRQGVAPGELSAFLEALRVFPALRLDGVMTHLYAADESDRAATEKQLAVLAECLRAMHGFVWSAGTARPQWLSVGNSAALLDASVRERLSAMAAENGLRLLLRPGIALYGIAPEFDAQPSAPIAAISGQLRPVLRWTTRITGLRWIESGAAVGYNASFRATHSMRLALIAVGYADGLARRLSNVGHALVAGQIAPYAGRISMDQAVLDVTEIPAERLATGDEVVLLGCQGQASVTAQDHACWAETIPWEVFTSISSRVLRIAKS